MLTKTPQETWTLFLEYIEERCSAAEFENWFAPILLRESSDDALCLEVPNIFVQEYLLDNYKKDLALFIPLKPSGELALIFVITEVKKEIAKAPSEAVTAAPPPAETSDLKLNTFYTFAH